MLQKRNSSIKPKPCKECGSIWHSRMSCPTIQKTVIRPNKHPMKRTRLKKIGKKTQKWFVTRKKFLKENPPDNDGYHWCAIKPCLLPGVPMVESGDPRLKQGAELVTVDHIIPRTKRPDLIHVQSNLQKAHGKCNEEKRSRVDEDYDTYGKVQRRRQTEAWLFVMSTDELMVRYLELLDLMEAAEDDIILRDLQIELDFVQKLQDERKK